MRRFEVAVGTFKLASMFSTIRNAAPRIGCAPVVFDVEGDDETSARTVAATLVAEAFARVAGAFTVEALAGVAAEEVEGVEPFALITFASGVRVSDAPASGFDDESEPLPLAMLPSSSAKYVRHSSSTSDGSLRKRLNMLST